MKNLKFFHTVYCDIYNTIKKDGNELSNINEVMFFYISVEKIIAMFQFYQKEMPNTDYALNIASNDDDFFNVPCNNTFLIFESEVAPYCISINKVLQTNRYMVSSAGDINSKPLTEEQRVEIANMLLFFLYHKATKIAQANHTINIRKGKDLVIPITYIRNENVKYSTKTEIAKGLDWKHSWEVMGHWRRIKGIGKDHNNNNNNYNYNQIGKTWVNPCVKGKGELVKKIRVVK